MSNETVEDLQKKGRALILSVIAAIIIAIASYFGLVTPQDNGTGTDYSASISQGYSASKDFWQVYFTAPLADSSDASKYYGGVDEALIAAINDVEKTLDIAAFEWHNPRLSEAVVAAHERGVTVRMVVDDEHTVESNEEAVDLDEEAPFQDIIDAEIPWRDDDRSGLMHNKFMIMDGATIWMGSMNYTHNGTYRNNNNMFVIHSQRAVAAYQAEFNEMFVDGEFGQSRSNQDGVSFAQDGIEVQVMFSPEDDPADVLLETINGAKSSIRFMTFSFTLDQIGAAVLDRANDGVNVRGIFEVRGSQTEYSELPLLFCAGLPIFQDGNSRTFHHKVFIIDEEIVVTGSFNISSNATSSNDENMVIVHDADLAAQYLAEYERMEKMASVPDSGDITCP
jgi:phosphatidylserine/phosphatidylglycerophosphate/cardiolipin synthase-like enzyme